MGIEIVKSKDPNGNSEILFSGLDSIDYFKIYLKILKDSHQFNIIDVFEGIYSNTAKLKSSNLEFELIWHEDVGIYFHSNNRNVDEEMLFQIAENTLPELIKYINE